MKRSTTTRRLLLFLTAAAGALAAATILAHPAAGQPHGPPPDVRLEKNLEALGLEPARMEKIRAILTSSKEKREQIRSQLRAAFDQMHALLQQDPPDEAAIMGQADKIGALQTEEHKAMLHTLLQVRAELTPEQRKKLLEMKERDAPRWHHRGGPRGPE